MDYRISEDLTITYIRGRVPNYLPGYKKVDKNTFVIDLESCKYRETITTVRPCGKKRYHQHCSLFDKIVNPSVCCSCLENEP